MIPLTPLIQKALSLSIQLHSSQKRKIDGGPYASHPISVAWLLSKVTNDEEIIAAGLLHDVLEDVPDYSYEDMKSDFGSTVANLVRDVSEDKDPKKKDDKKLTWETRKQNYLEHLKLSEEKACLISLADKLHNLSDLTASLSRDGDEVWNKFNATREQTLWFFREIYQAISPRISNQLTTEYEKLLNNFH